MASGKLNRMQSTALAGKMVNNHWDTVFASNSDNVPLCWYEGDPIGQFLQAMGIRYAHGEAFSAILAARHQELAPQQEAEMRGYNRELCSYARTHMGCALYSQRGWPDELKDSIATKLPKPDLLISVYPYCNTGLLWDDFTERLFGVGKIPKFNIHIPFLFGGDIDGYCYMRDPQYEEAKGYIVKQLLALTDWLAAFMGKPFDWDKFTELMAYTKTAATLRVEGMKKSGAATPAPASFFDWSAAIAPISFAESGPECVNVYQAMNDEIDERIAKGVGSVANERYRLYWDGITNWNKLGWLAKKFAEYDACVVNGRYCVGSFFPNPERIDLDNPLDGFADSLLACNSNHGYPAQMQLCEDMIKENLIDGIIMHSARTCRAQTNPQLLISEYASRKLGVCVTNFEGDTVDESFYQDEILNSHVEALLEAIDARRAKA